MDSERENKNREINKITKSAFVVVFVTFLSKFFGFIREIFLGKQFGVSYKTDAFLVANTVPIIIFTYLIYSVMTAYFPIYSKIKVEEGEKESIKFTNNILNGVILISVILIVLCMVFTKQLIQILGSGFDKQTMDLSIKLTRILLPMIIFIGISQVLTGFLQSNRCYVIPAMNNVPGNIIVIGALIFSSQIGIEGVTVAVLIGAIFQVILQLPYAKKISYRYKFFINYKDKNIKAVGKLIVPIFISNVLLQLNLLIDRTLASGLKEGSIAALNFANKLNLFVFGIISVSLAAIIFPMLSELVASKNLKKFVKIVEASINVITVLTMPIVFFVINFRTEIVKVLFQYGKFDTVATQMTASALLFYALGMLFYGYRDVLNKVFYSLEDSKTPMINGGLAVVINVILNFLLIKYMQHDGLALATSISALVTTVLLIYNLTKKVNEFSIKSLIETLIKTIVASGIMVIFSKILFDIFLNNISIFNRVEMFFVLTICCILGIGLYIILIYLFKVKEVNIIMDSIIKKIFKKNKYE